MISAFFSSFFFYCPCNDGTVMQLVLLPSHRDLDVFLCVGVCKCVTGVPASVCTQCSWIHHDQPLKMNELYIRVSGRGKGYASTILFHIPLQS